MTTNLAARIAHEHLPHCDAAGSGPRSDRDAEKHTKTTGHATSSVTKPNKKT